jgi:hypothetical protein
MWAVHMRDVDQVQRTSHFAGKVMITAFFNGSREWTVDRMEKARTMNSQYFIPDVVAEVAAIYCPQGRRPCQQRCMLHDGSTPVQKMRKGEGSLEHFGLL